MRKKAMDTCADMRDLLADALLGGLDSSQKAVFESHIAGCESCAREFERLGALMTLLREYQRPEPDDGYWRHWEEKLESRLDSIAAEDRPERRLGGWIGLVHRVWMPAAAAAVLIGAIALGWHITSDSGRQGHTAAVSPSPSPAHISVVIEARRYLDRSKLVLLGMRTFDPAEADEFRPSFARESEISRQLIRESASLKEQLASTNQVRLCGLVNDLDVVLLQIANLGRDYDERDLELIQLCIERKALLFKINLEDMVSSAEDRASDGNEPRS